MEKIPWMTFGNLVYHHLNGNRSKHKIHLKYDFIYYSLEEDILWYHSKEAYFYLEEYKISQNKKMTYIYINQKTILGIKYIHQLIVSTNVLQLWKIVVWRKLHQKALIKFNFIKYLLKKIQKKVVI